MLDGPSINQRGDFYVGTIFYREECSPAWDVTNNYKDVAHNLAWVVVRGKRAALLASDAAMREAILEHISSADVIDRDAAFAAFVGNHARTVWLSGTHSRTDVKADSKMLMGSALEEALDPLGDHSYHLSALRSQPQITALGSQILGVALASGRVWSVRPKSLAQLLTDIGALFDRLENPPASRTTRFDFLSQPVRALTSVQQAYDVAILPEVLLDSAATGIMAPIAQAQEWAYETRHIVTPGTGSDFSVTVEFQGTNLGTLQ